MKPIWALIICGHIWEIELALLESEKANKKKMETDHVRACWYFSQALNSSAFVVFLPGTGTALYRVLAPVGCWLSLSCIVQRVVRVARRRVEPARARQLGEALAKAGRWRTQRQLIGLYVQGRSCHHLPLNLAEFGAAILEPDLNKNWLSKVTSRV